ncbi:MAG: sigma-70 family RNA polymerase sigma factor [Dehalococcoidia bacterium]|nr:sigma-70 family RNA polymerase sigma factor [Dehalococcoidia bacterium]
MFEQWLEEARLIAYRSVFNMAWRSRGKEQHHDAENAAQQGVLAAVTRGEANFNDEYALINFVNTSAINSARNVWTSAFKRRTRDFKTIPKKHLDEKDGSLPPDELVFQEERRAFLQQGLEDIGERCREILTLYYYNALNDRQISLELEGDQANDNDRRMIGTQRKRCLTEIHRRWLKKGVDPEDWF